MVFCQDLTDTLRYVKSSAVQIAEYWGSERGKGVAPRPDGMGFDVGYSDTLRNNLRGAVSETTRGRSAHVNLDRVRDALYVFHVHNDNRVIAFHRWLPGVGRDVVVVASLNESTFYGRSYRLGFPAGGQWEEVFNSDIYDNFFNPNAQGNAGGVRVDGSSWDGLPNSAEITLPANSILIFARDFGD